MGYEKLGLQQLRELCDAFGLATDGKKAELVHEWRGSRAKGCSPEKRPTRSAQF